MRQTLYPVPGFPGYVVTDMGVVYSMKQPIPRRIRVYETPQGALCVRMVSAAGKRHVVRIRKLLYQHGLELEDWMKDQLRQHERERKRS